MNNDPDKEPFQPAIRTKVKVVSDRSFSNLKRNTLTHKMIENERKKIQRIGTVEGYLNQSVCLQEEGSTTEGKVSQVLVVKKPVQPK